MSLQITRSPGCNSEGRSATWRSAKVLSISGRAKGAPLPAARTGARRSARAAEENRNRLDAYPALPEIGAADAPRQLGELWPAPPCGITRLYNVDKGILTFVQCHYYLKPIQRLQIPASQPRATCLRSKIFPRRRRSSSRAATCAATSPATCRTPACRSTRKAIRCSNFTASTRATIATARPSASSAATTRSGSSWSGCEFRAGGSRRSSISASTGSPKTGPTARCGSPPGRASSSTASSNPD